MKPLTYILVDFENTQPSPEDIARLRGDEYRVWVFRGPHQKKFDGELVEALQPLGGHVQYVKSSKHGKNALDFHIAFCLGQIQQENASAKRSARYIVVTKDGGFDPLFEYMKTLECAVGKAHSVPEALALADSLVPVPFSVTELPAAVSVTSPVSSPVSTGLKSTAEPSLQQEVAQPSVSSQAGPVAKKAAATRRGAMIPEDVEKVIADLRTHPKNRPADRKALQHHIVSILSNKVTIQVSHAVIKALEEKKALTFNGKKAEYKLPKAKK